MTSILASALLRQETSSAVITAPVTVAKNKPEAFHLHILIMWQKQNVVSLVNSHYDQKTLSIHRNF